MHEKIITLNLLHITWFGILGLIMLKKWDTCKILHGTRRMRSMRI